MRTLVFVGLLCWMTAASAEIYRWTDENGKQIYGDEPPENARAVEAIDLPMLTVAESFKGKPKPVENQAATSAEPIAQAASTKPSSASPMVQAEKKPIAASGYDNFSILTPSSDEVIRSESDVQIKVDLQPTLKKGHGIVVYVDGRQVGETANDALNVTGIERGEHSVFAVLHDDQDAILGNTEAVNFTVMRNSLASRVKTSAHQSSKSASAKDSSTDPEESSTLSNRRF